MNEILIVIDMNKMESLTFFQAFNTEKILLLFF